MEPRRDQIVNVDPLFWSAAMETRSRIQQIDTLKDRLVQQAENLRKQAEGMPAGIRRDELVAKARQAERAARVDEWLSSPDLRPPR
jgi:hypothetical protein